MVDRSSPNGAVIKPSADSPRLFSHRGRVVVFESIEDLRERIDDPELDVDENSVLVLKGCGPLALVRDGDEISLDGRARRLDLQVSPEELARRGAEWQRNRPPQKYTRGYYRQYIEHVTQADRGCDLDFLVGSSGSTLERESH
jgi:dihydroxyacid dehydratase/phosphogluconate dehydratase